MKATQYVEIEKKMLVQGWGGLYQKMYTDTDTIAETSKPFKWFPELEPLFESPNVKKVTLDFIPSEKNVLRSYIEIIK
jgi:hypothetical protein